MRKSELHNLSYLGIGDALNAEIARKDEIAKGKKAEK